MRRVNLTYQDPQDRCAKTYSFEDIYGLHQTKVVPGLPSSSGSRWSVVVILADKDMDLVMNLTEPFAPGVRVQTPRIRDPGGGARPKYNLSQTVTRQIRATPAARPTQSVQSAQLAQLARLARLAQLAQTAPPGEDGEEDEKRSDQHNSLQDADGDSDPDNAGETPGDNAERNPGEIAEGNPNDNTNDDRG